MSKIWLFMVVSAISVLIFKAPNEVISAMQEASLSSLELCINLCAIYAIWLGLLEVLDASGLSDKLANGLNPIIKFLFKTDNKETNKYIAINLSSNILGLGNAATPSGIKAIRSMDTGDKKASFACIMLLVINCCSIQLLPTTVIGLRENAGSLTPSDIILPTIIATALTVTFAVLLVFLCNRIFHRKKC